MSRKLSAGSPGQEMALALGLVGVGGLVALMGSTSVALGLVAIAGAGAAALVRTAGRVVVGVALVAVSIVLVLVGSDPWRLAAVLGGVPVGLGALLIVIRARRWPRPPRRDRGAPSGAGTGARGPKDMWDELDRGEDPTV